MSGELGEFLAEAGAVVGGGAVLGATLGFIVGSLVHDFLPDVDPGRMGAPGRLLRRARGPGRSSSNGLRLSTHDACARAGTCSSPSR